MKLTDEQKVIVESTGDIKINAVAGSGKTTTLIEYAKAQPSETRILYLAFNRSVKLEAIDKFAKKKINNIDVHTPHSLAYRNIVYSNNYSVTLGYKRHEITELLGLNWKGSTGFLLAGHIQAYADLFCNYNLEKVAQVDYISTIKNEKAREFSKAFQKEILDGTRKFLAMMNRGDISVTHGFYLKKFQLSKPLLPYDIILFDEGQDASPVMLDVFLAQNAKKIIVGDIHQQIYGWRNAINALQNVNFKEYSLSKSFRFDNNVANLAIEILNWKQHLKENANWKIEGLGKKKKKIRSSAFIARTNLTLFTMAIELVFERGEINSLYFEGNLNSYTYASEGASLFDVLNLYNGKKEFIRDPVVKSMESFSDLCKYAEEQADQELNMIIELVRKYDDKIPWYIKKIREMHVADDKREQADMIFSTVHRCKGMEYDSVTLGNDFISEEKLLKIVDKIEKGEEKEVDFSKLNEEINLLYVAVTRCTSKLQLSKDTMPNISKMFLLKEYCNDKRDSDTFTFNKKGKKKRAEKSGSYWKYEDDIDLEKMLYRGKSVKEVAKTLGRSISAIRSRIRKLELDELFFE